MRTPGPILALVAFAALPACAGGSGSSGSTSTTSVGAAAAATKPTASPSPAAPTSGSAPSASPSPAPSGPAPLDPAKAAHWLYTSSGGNGTNGGIVTFAVDPSTGELTPASDTPVPQNFGAFCLATDPTGSILFVTGVGGSGAAGALMPFAISNGSTLTPGTPLPTASLVPFALAVDPVGQTVFTGESSTLSAFSYAAGTGALTAEAPLQDPAGTQWERGLCIDPTGSWLYCALHPGAGVEVVPIANGAFVTGATPTTIALSPAHDVCSLCLAPSGNVLYVGTPDDVVSVLVQANGSWTQTDVHAHNPAITSEPVTITALALDPQGQFLATSNGGPNSYPGTDDASLFSVGAGGSLTLVTTTKPLVGSAPNNVIWNAGGSVFYVADTWTNSIGAFAASATGVTELPGSPYTLPNGEQLPTGLAVAR